VARCRDGKQDERAHVVLQSLISLVTIIAVAAGAINILGS
jgi:hypothetical protein